MRDFFRGWKRRAGVATLMMACLFAAGWVGSLDLDEFPVLWSHHVDEETYYEARMWKAGIHFAKFTLTERNESFTLYGASSITVWYWAIVLPLTLLSAWLLLSKPPAP